MHAMIKFDGPKIISGAFRDEAGTSHAANVLTLWTQAELAFIGVYPVVDDAIPEGQIQTGSTLERDGDVVRRRWTLAPAPPPPVPSSVSPLQMRRALRQQGLTEAVAAYVAQQNADTQDAWEYAVEIRRDDALIASAARAMNKTDAQIDDLFRLALTF